MAVLGMQGPGTLEFRGTAEARALFVVCLQRFCDLGWTPLYHR